MAIPSLTKLELQIMKTLWKLEMSSIRQMQEAFPDEDRPAYTTVQTMLNVLLRKKKVKRVQEGRAYRYRPAVSRERASGSALRDLVTRMFGGSSEALLMAMVDTRQISAEELARVAQKLADADKRKPEEEQ